MCQHLGFNALLRGFVSNEVFAPRKKNQRNYGVCGMRAPGGAFMKGDGHLNQKLGASKENIKKKAREYELLTFWGQQAKSRRPG